MNYELELIIRAIKLKKCILNAYNSNLIILGFNRKEHRAIIELSGEIDDLSTFVTNWRKTQRGEVNHE